MKVLKKIILASILITPLFSGSYVVPAEFDNFRLGHLSAKWKSIPNDATVDSQGTYKFGGQNVIYRCIVEPKIECVASVANLLPVLSEVSVKHAGELPGNPDGKPVGEGKDEILSLWSADVRIEVDPSGKNWLICGAAYAGERSDKSELKMTGNVATGAATLAYTYEPNLYHYDVIAFGKIVGGLPANFHEAGGNSYMTIQYHQVCR